MKLIECTRCPLHKTRTQVVKGAGNRNSKVMFIGEAPGKNEDEQGIPFIGKAGGVLQTELEKHKIKDFYITNVVKCRPPNNRDPLDSEKEKCKTWLELELKIIKPQFIVTLGRHAFRSIDMLFELTRVDPNKDDFFNVRGKKMWVVKMYHPAAVLYNPALWDPFGDTFEKFAKYLKSA